MGFLEERNLDNVEGISDFYNGKTVFITGGSGFMGKVLIEKLLYSCPGLDRIYLLVRTKKGVKSEDRLAELYSSICFDRLRNERPGYFESKVFVVAGDVMELGLGLSDEDRALIVQKVNVIFHVAASVRFDDPLTFATKMNLRGTKEIVALAKEVHNLAVIVHVSTSYSNTNRDPIEEVMYPPHADWREILEICDKTDEHTIRVLTQKMIGELPNTYTFTKQLAEHVVYEERGKLPAVIIRPSIVVSSHEEPTPGWIENFNGPVGLLVASGKGIMRSFYSDPSLSADYMPVDIAIKHIIIASWIRGIKKLEPSDDIPIYNCCAGGLVSMTVGEMVEVGKKIGATMPLNDILWTIGGSLTPSKTLHFIKVIFLHLLPALIIDGILMLLGKKPNLVKIHRRIYIANIALQYYLTNQWTFCNKNLMALRAAVKEEDRKSFYHAVESIDKYEFFKNSVIGGRKYLLKEKDEDLPKAKAHYRRIVFLDKAVQCLFYGYIFWWIINTEVAKNAGQFVLDLICL